MNRLHKFINRRSRVLVNESELCAKMVSCIIPASRNYALSKIVIIVVRLINMRSIRIISKKYPKLSYLHYNSIDLFMSCPHQYFSIIYV